MLAFSQATNAQLAVETFNSGFPATWSMVNNDNLTVNTSMFSAPIPATLTAQAWMTRLRATGDSVMLTVSAFSPVGRADRWLISPSFQVNNANMIIKWEDWCSAGTSYRDTIQIWVSPTAGTTTSSFTQKIYEGPATAYDDPTPYQTHGASLAAYNGQTIRIAVRNNTYNQGSVRVDNVGTQNMSAALDAAATKVNFRNIVSTTSSTPLTAVVTNMGSSNITSIQASYKLDAGSPVTQTFTTNISPLGTATLSFTTPIANPSVGSHTITFNILQVNGGADNVTTNNQATTNFAVATGSVPRNGIIEEFSSSTCSPCASFNATFDPLIQTNNVNVPSSHFNAVKYQMNWPSPGNDVSYNNDGLTRRTYYGVTGIPDHFTNGAQGTTGNQSEIDASKTDPAYVTLSGSYEVKSDSIIAKITMTPNFSLSGVSYKLLLSATEKHYQNTGNTTGQLDYYHVMRKMLPDGNGIAITSFTAGVPQTFRQSYGFTTGTVTQMSNIFWGNPYNGNLVAYLQDVNSHEILQSVSIPAVWSGVNDVVGNIKQVKLYPNPATNNGTYVSVNLEKSSTLTISVTDVLGHLVYSTNNEFGNGEQNIFIPTNNFESGIYNITVASEDASQSVKLTITK
jgi:hypothetical protein